MSESTPEPTNRLGGVTISTGETFPALLSLFGMCADYWAANEQVESGDYAWPTTPNGFVLECTTAGRTGAKEPKLRGLGAGDTVTDGSCTWTLRVPTNSTGINPITSASVVEAPDELTVSAPIVSENTKLLVDYTSEEVDVTYEVVFEAIIGGRPRRACQEVHVARK